MADEPRLRKRATFDEVAELYATARPRYPDIVIEDVVELGGFRPGSRIVEVGCGTGQATAALAERGLDITCIELGARLAEVARRELADHPSVRVINADFEHWQPDAGEYDGVVSFNAFHWIDPARRYELAGRLLRPGGALAVVQMPHVVPPGSDPFFLEAQEDYRAVGLAGDEPPPTPDDISDLGAEFDANRLFEPVTVRRRVLEHDVTADDHIALIGTFSNHLLMPVSQREDLAARLRRRFERRPSGTARKSVLYIVHVARKR